MAIQGVTFMGKEGCIEPAIKKITKKTETYMGKEPINLENSVKKVEERLGDLRKSDLAAFEASHGNINIKPEPTGDQIAEAWKAAHGIKA